jgi:peptide/nickel transport system permease protein
LSERRVTFKHALRAAIVPVITIFGLDFAYLLAGTVFTEYIFNIQGIGLTAIAAIFQKDLPIISATVLIAATFVVTMNLIVDIIYSVIDPRVRLS